MSGCRAQTTDPIDALEQENGMDLRRIRYFTAVAEACSISKAASRLGIAQPTLSRQIQLLEHELRCALFYRDGRGVKLTEAGEKLHSVLSPMIMNLDRVQAEILGESEVPSGVVRFGIPPSIGSTIVAQLVLRFQVLCPDVQLHVIEGFSGNLLEWIEHGIVDVGILYDVRRSQSMNVQTVLDEDLYLIDSPLHGRDDRPATQDDIRLPDLVLPGRGHGLRRIVDALSDVTGLHFEPKIEIDSVPALKQLVETGKAQTILPFGAVHREVKDGRLVARRLDIEGARARLVLTTALHRPVTKATRMLIEVVKEEIARCMKNGILRGRADRALSL